MTGQEIQLILGLLCAVAALALMAERIRIPYPILLVVAGTALGFIPGLPRQNIQLEPDLVFLLFLPPLLYHGGFLTTWRDFRANITAISLLAVGLVLVTILAIAFAAHWMIPMMPLAAACALGAIISPTDAIAATAIAEQMKVPRRVVTVLEGESLVNDATALVAFSIAVAAVQTGQFSIGQASIRFLILVIGGIAVGLIAGFVISQLHKRVHEPHIEGMISLLGPYIAYIPAEHFKVSGVLAAVTAGIYMARQAPRVLSANGRMRLTSVWETLVFLLNGLAFILIGLQLPFVVESLSHVRVGTLVKYGVVISLVTILVRLAWVYALSGVAGPVHRGKRVPWAQVSIVGWAGMRGIVSLAAALSLPVMINNDKTPFPQRDMIIYLTFMSILFTLVLQGLTLGPIIRRLKLGDDGLAQKEEWEARLDAAHAAVARLQTLSLEEEIDESYLAQVRAEYDERIARLATLRRGVAPELSDERSLILRRLHHEALTAERRMLTLLRDHNVIGDEVLRRVIRDIDLAEARLGQQ